MHMHMSVFAKGSQNYLLNPLWLEFQLFVSYHQWPLVLGTKLSSPVSATISFNHWITSKVPGMDILFWKISVVHFWDHSLIATFLSSFFSIQSFFHRPHLTLIQIHVLFLHCYCVRKCTCVCLGVFLNVAYWFHNDVACMCVFRADSLVLDNWLVSSSLKSPTSSISIFHQLPAGLCVRRRPGGLFLLYFGMFIGVNLIQLTFGLGSHVSETLYV